MGREGATQCAPFHRDRALLRRDATVLEIGCGVGRMTRYVAPHVGRLLALDVSGEMLRRARDRSPALGNVDWIEGDGVSLAALGNASVDLAFAYIVFQHLPRAVVWR